MTTRTPTRRPASLPSPPDDVVRTAALRASGVSAHALASRCRPSGPWQRLFPGVILLGNAPPTRRQLRRAALTYAGPQAILTGTDAVLAHGMAAPPTEEVLVLIPAGRRVASRTHLTVERTTRLPAPQRRAGLPVAPLVRATIDAARRERDRDRLRSLLFHPVQQGACSLADLRAELDSGNQRGSAAVRALLTDPGQGEIAPVVEALAMRVLVDAPLPPPRWQVPLHSADGSPLGVADAWWPTAGLAWNLGTADPPLPTSEQAHPTLAAAGITVLHTDPTRLHTAPDAVAAELMEAFVYASRNPHLT